MKNEMKPKTVEEAFVSEYYALKEEVRRLEEEKKEITEDKEFVEKEKNNAIEWISTFKKAIKAIKLTMNGDCSISIQNNFVFKTDDDYDELKEVFETFCGNVIVAGIPPIGKD